VISCWEIAKKAERGKLAFDHPVDKWIEGALKYPGVQLLPLSVEVLVASTQLPGDFHKDPADQMIVATAMELAIPLLTSDQKILNYQYVSSIF
jgi:PIN domain nuclease of toxin-antitoxin system